MFYSERRNRNISEDVPNPVATSDFSDFFATAPKKEEKQKKPVPKGGDH